MNEEELRKYYSSPVRRLENNHYALKNAYQKLKEAIDKNHDQEIYAATGEMLLWVMTTDEWHKKHDKGYKGRRNKNDEGKILFGLLHAYNCMKHNMDFIRIHKAEGGFSFPIEFPLEIPPLTIHWNTTEEEKLDGEFKNQKENYIKYIEGKEILETFNQALIFLNQEKSKYCSK